MICHAIDKVVGGLCYHDNCQEVTMTTDKVHSGWSVVASQLLVHYLEKIFVTRKFTGLTSQFLDSWLQSVLDADNYTLFKDLWYVDLSIKRYQKKSASLLKNPNSRSQITLSYTIICYYYQILCSIVQYSSIPLTSDKRNAEVLHKPSV